MKTHARAQNRTKETHACNKHDIYCPECAKHHLCKTSPSSWGSRSFRQSCLISSSAPSLPQSIIPARPTWSTKADMQHTSGIFASFTEFKHQDLSYLMIINLTWHTSFASFGYVHACYTRHIIPRRSAAVICVGFWEFLHFGSSVTLFTIVDASVHGYRTSVLCSSLLVLTHAPLVVSMNVCSFNTFSRFLIPSMSVRVQYFRETSAHTRQSRLEFQQPLFVIDLYLLTTLRCYRTLSCSTGGCSVCVQHLPPELGALCRCCAACWKTAPSLLQLQWCCPLRLLRFSCWCPAWLR